MKNKALLANIFFVIAVIIWASTFFIIKDSLMGINAITLVCYRSLLAAFILGICLIITKENILQNFSKGAILGFLYFSLFFCLNLGLTYTTASNSGFIFGLFVVFVPVFAFIFEKRIPKTLNIIAIILALIGLWFLTGGISNLNKGDLIVLGAAASGGLQIIVIDKFIKSKVNIFVLNFQQFFVGGLIAFIAIILFKQSFAITTHFAFYSLIYLAVFANVLCYISQFVVQRYTSPHTVSIIMSLQPAIAAVFAWTLGGEQMHLTQIVGGTFALSATIFAAFAEKPQAALKIIAFIQKLFNKERVRESF